jgi:hypothetical protein
MQTFRKLLIDLQVAIFTFSSKYESSAQAARNNTMRFLLLLFLYYFSFSLLVMGLVMKRIGPLHLNRFQALILVVGVPFGLYKLFLESLIVHEFDFCHDQIQRAKYIRLYWYGTTGGFGALIGTMALLVALQNN